MSNTEETVFIVDDDTSVRKSLVRLFRSSGMKVEAYASAREFMARMPIGGKSCVILDLTLPDTTGLELCNQMVEKGCRLPTIFLTGGSDIVLRAAATEECMANVVDFFTKPVDSNVLLKAVRLALQQSVPEPAKS